MDKKTEESMNKAVQKELKRMERRRKSLATLCFVVAIGCIGYFVVYTYMNYRTQKNTDVWSTLRDSSAEKIQKPTTTNQPVTVNKTAPTEAPPVLDEYADLLNKNKSLVGWVRIEDTKIDYPVLQTANNEYYLDHNFSQQYDKNGSIFLDAGCNIIDRSTNLIVYGHHMKSGAMFGSLNLYEKQDYYKKHRYFQFDTIYEKGRYEICYVFRAEVYDEDEIRFKYYQFIDANSEIEFESNMYEMAQMSLYDTGITPAYGDELVTLSTCDRSQTREGRFVVVGVRVE